MNLNKEKKWSVKHLGNNCLNKTQMRITFKILWYILFIIIVERTQNIMLHVEDSRDDLFKKLYSVPMIRESAVPYRLDAPIKTIDDIIKFIDKYDGNKPAFMSIYSYVDTYNVSYRNQKKKEGREVKYPKIIFDRIILDFDINKIELLNKEGITYDEIILKGAEIINKNHKLTASNEAIERKGVEFYSEKNKRETEKEIRELTRGMKSKDKKDTIMKYYYDKYSSNEYLKTPYLEAIKVHSYLKERFGIYSQLFFSGGHGVHLYCLFQSVDIDNPNELVEKFGLNLKEKLNLTTLDTTVIKSVNKHLIRIPLSRHQETKLYVVPFAPTCSYENVIELATTSTGNMDLIENQDTTIFEDFLKSFSKQLQEENTSVDVTYEYNLTGNIFDLQEPFSRIYTEGQRNYTAHPLIHFFKGVGISKKDTEHFFKTLPAGTGLDSNVQSWINTAYNSNKPYQANMGYFINIVKEYAHNNEDKEYIIKKFNQYFNGEPIHSNNEVELAPGYVQFQNENKYKDGLYVKTFDKNTGEYKYSFKGNILIHEMIKTHDILNQFPPVISINYTNTEINDNISKKNVTFEELSQNISDALLIDDNSQGIESILRKITTHSINKDLKNVNITANKGIFKRGFFYKDGKIIDNVFSDLTYSKEDVKKAIRIVNELIENRGTAKGNECNVFRFMLWSPFGWIIKEIGMNKANYGLILSGASRANKTGSVTNFTYLYSNPDDIIQTADTVSAFGTRLEENTLPLLLDESYNLFINPDMEEIQKRNIWNKSTRSTKKRTGNNRDMDNFMALRLPIYAINQDVGNRKPEFLRRYKINSYDLSMVVSEKDESEFNKKYKPDSPNTPLKDLKYLGKAFADRLIPYLEDESDELFEIEELVVKILKDICEWCSSETENITFIDEIYYIQDSADGFEVDTYSLIQRELSKLFRKNHKQRFGFKGYMEEDFILCAENNEISWLYHIIDKEIHDDVFAIHKSEFEHEISRICNKKMKSDEILDVMEIELKDEINPKGIKGEFYSSKTIKGFKLTPFQLIYKLFGIKVPDHEQLIQDDENNVNNKI